MHISPLIFEDGGEYRCIFNNHERVLVKLITIQVSVAPSGDEGRDQTVVLTCELSELSDVPVTLAWLRREGSGVLMVRQEVLTDSRLLSVTLPSLHRDQLFWECVVFSQGLLRARVTLNLTDSFEKIPTPVTPIPNAGGKVNPFHLGMIVACSVLLFTGILTVALLFYYRGARNRETASRPVLSIVASPSLTDQDDPVYGNVTNNPPDEVPDSHRSPTEGENNMDIHYSCISLSGLKPREQNGNSEKSGDGDGVIYSAVSIN
ncbi:uncharacterized protein [Osmerus mordax]|uniref:uncharacterized protein n=1 Tax=Osmerus mordax TaxID=8014 RepID=UPI00350EC521